MRGASRRQRNCNTRGAIAATYEKKFILCGQREAAQTRGGGGVEGAPRFGWRVNCAAVPVGSCQINVSGTKVQRFRVMRK